MNILENIKKFSEENRIASICDGDVLTYNQLEKYSEAFASYIVKKVSPNNTPIVIYGNKDNMILVAMIAALKSGRAYVPLDITLPIDRVNKIIEDVNPEIIVNLSEEDLNYDGIITKNELFEIIKEFKDVECSKEMWVKEDENCYILFTSGSTGKPKGVQISKNNLDSFTEWFSYYLDVNNENTAILNQPSYSFDLSVMPVYLGLINGKILYTLSKKTLENMKETFNQLRESDMTLWISTPSFAAVCAQDDSFCQDMMPNLKTMYFIGEILSVKLAKEMRKRFPNVRIINSYGPTEATVAVTGIDITDEILEREKVLPIGYSMDGCVIRVVDDSGNVVEDGEKGELVILGKSVSKGYFNNPEMTNKVFFNEVIDGEFYRGYKTGDMGYIENGVLYFCGRKDFQIKLNGFRIELEDIENNIRKVNNIKNVVVLPVYKEEKVANLVAFVILEKENDLSNLKNTLKIKEELKEYLPAYMIPKNIKIVKEFPVNNNDKIDRKRLMEGI